MAADDALIQAMGESCGRLCNNHSFYNRGPHFSHNSCTAFLSHAVICVISLTNMNRI